MSSLKKNPKRVKSLMYLVSLAFVLIIMNQKLIKAQSKIVQVSAGAHFTAALSEDGTVWTWGQNYFGQLGDGTTDDRSTPYQVCGLSDIVSISAGSSYMLAIKRDGTIYAWGCNEGGQLGDGTTINRYLPVKVSSAGGLDKAKSISAGSMMNLALKEDGTVYSWGYGYLGNGTRAESLYPVKVNSLSSVKKISVCDRSAVVLKEDGTVWSWGENNHGQLGDGTYISKLSPVRVKNLTGIIAVSAGDRVCLALKNDQSVWTWGNGILGNGKTEKTNIPVKISKLRGINQIAVGEEHYLASDYNGRIWGWGNNSYGQLGDGTTDDRLTPVNANAAYIGNIDTGMYHSVAVNYVGEVFTWGYNRFGQLGNDGSWRESESVLNVPIPEPNTSIDTSCEISKDVLTKGVLVQAKEYRYYKFVPQKTNDYTIESISNMDTYGYLYDSSGNVISSNDDGNKKGESDNNRDFYIKYQLEAGKTYYIGIRAYSSSVVGNFNVIIKYWDDFGNRIADAYKISDNIEGRINFGGDVDIFKYTPSKDGIYSFEAVSDFDSYGVLYDSSGKQIIYNDDGNKAGESQNSRDFYFKYRLNKGKKYYIKVKNYYTGEDDIGKYTLKIKYNDDYENEMSEAYNIGAKEVITGEINYGGDVDMFMFVPPENGTYTIESDSDIDLYGYLYYSGSQLTKNDDGNGVGVSSNNRDFYIKYNLKAGNVYCVKVNAFSTSVTGEYILRVRRCYSSVVNNYYDQAFDVRYGSIGDCASKIQDTNRTISRVFKKTVNLDIAINTPICVTTLADNCKLKRGFTISKDTIDQMCPGGAGHEPNCTGWTDSYLDFYNKNKGNDTTTTVLWTGNALYENGKKINRSFSWYKGICIQEISSGQNYYEKMAPTLAHELAHQYGAPDHYHEILENGTCRGGTMCNTCNPGSGRSEYCIMNYCWINDISTRDPEKVFCPNCLQDIKNHLKGHH